jgi:AcrR family transcriptional regulator
VSAPDYPAEVSGSVEDEPLTRLARRDRASGETRSSIVDAARRTLLADGHVALSTRRVAELAGVPLSQIHYHFGSKRQLVLAVLAAENERLLDRQARMFGTAEPLWVRWDRACDFLEEDLASGYVRILQEMIAAGWSDPEVAKAVRELMSGWYVLLADVARREAEGGGNLGPFTPEEVAALMALPFLGAEQMILLGMPDAILPVRSALRKVGELLRRVGPTPGGER